jgi:hypothetical protein
VLLTLDGLHRTPHPAGFAQNRIPAGANRRDLLQNPGRQLFDGVETLRIVAQSIGGECGEPEGKLGCLFRKLLQPGSPDDGSEPSITVVGVPDTRPNHLLGYWQDPGDGHLGLLTAGEAERISRTFKVRPERIYERSATRRLR